MTKDLEETLRELGPGYREVAERVIGAYGEPRVVAAKAKDGIRLGRITGWSAGYLVAASLLVTLGLWFVFAGAADKVRSSDTYMVYTAAYAPDENALSAILASQRPDGSWDNDFITRQNAAALRSSENAEIRIAYKKAVRYLKSKGLRPLTDFELKARSDEAAHVMSQI